MRSSGEEVRSALRRDMIREGAGRKIEGSPSIIDNVEVLLALSTLKTSSRPGLQLAIEAMRAGSSAEAAGTYTYTATVTDTDTPTYTYTYTYTVTGTDTDTGTYTATLTETDTDTDTPTYTVMVTDTGSQIVVGLGEQMNEGDLLRFASQPTGSLQVTREFDPPNDVVPNDIEGGLEGIATLRAIQKEMDEVLLEAEVAVEDAKLFLASRGVSNAKTDRRAKRGAEQKVAQGQHRRKAS